MNDHERRIDARLILSILATGILSFSGVVVETAMNVTFPTLMVEFSVGTTTVQWITTGYLLVLAAVIPTSAYLRRRWTTKALFATAVTLFVAGTTIAAIAPVFEVLLAGRIVQGFGTGIALPLMFNIVLEQAPFERMGLMIGIASLITAMAPAVGPSLGGMIVESFGWRMIFVCLLPLLAASFFMGMSSIRQVAQTTRTSFRILDWLLLATSFSCFIFATSNASEAGWASVQTIGLLAASILAFAAFCRRSLHTDRPLLNLTVVRCRPFAASLASIMLMMFICLGLGYLVPNYAQIVLGMDAFAAGCLLLPGCALAATMTPVAGRVLDRLGARIPILFGNAGIIGCTLAFSLLADVLTPLLIVGSYLLFSIGQGAAFGNTMTNGIRHLPQELSADGNAVMTTMQQLAGALGTSVVATVVGSAQRGSENLASATAAGSVDSFHLLAALAFCTLACSLAALFPPSSKCSDAAFETPVERP